MNKNKKIILGVIIAIIILGGAYFVYKSISGPRPTKQININGGENLPIANQGPVSPVSGLSCENWNRRPFAVMQPADVSARPAAGFSDADMVIEMPVITASITRLMAIYVCGNPDDVGSMRSSRH